MLCSVYNEDIFQDDELKCTTCIECLHFTCISFEEVNFRKMEKITKNNWCCANCKSVTVINTVLSQKENSFVVPNETLSNLTDR